MAQNRGHVVQTSRDDLQCVVHRRLAHNRGQHRPSSATGHPVSLPITSAHPITLPSPSAALAAAGPPQQVTLPSPVTLPTPPQGYTQRSLFKPPPPPTRFIFVSLHFDVVLCCVWFGHVLLYSATLRACTCILQALTRTARSLCSHTVVLATLSVPISHSVVSHVSCTATCAGTCAAVSRKTQAHISH